MEKVNRIQLLKVELHEAIRRREELGTKTTTEELKLGLGRGIRLCMKISAAVAKLCSAITASAFVPPSFVSPPPFFYLFFSPSSVSMVNKDVLPRDVLPFLCNFRCFFPPSKMF